MTEQSEDGTFIGHKDGMWGFFIKHKWQSVSASVWDCINDAEEAGYTVDYAEEGDKITVHNLHKK
jgi:hypothetical protein